MPRFHKVYHPRVENRMKPKSVCEGRVEACSSTEKPTPCTVECCAPRPFIMQNKNSPFTSANKPLKALLPITRKGEESYCLVFSLFRLVTISANLDAAKAIGLAFRTNVCLASWTSLFQIIPQPTHDQLSEAAVACRTNS